MARVTNVFALQPAGNVAASKLDVNFGECASYPELEVDGSLNRSVVVGDDGHTIVRTNASPMGDTLPTPTGTGGNFPVGFEVTIQASTNTVTLTPTASTINGAASLVVTAGSSAVVNTDGTNWYAQIGTAASGSIPNVSRQTKTGAYTLISSDKGTLVEATANSWTLDFTTAATLATGFWCYLKNSGAGEIVLEPFGAQTIDGLTNFILYPNETRLLLCDGSNFFTTLIAPGYQVYASTGTWTKPPGASMLYGMVWGAGGGGGGGRTAAAGNARPGGGGGGGGGFNFFTVPFIEMAATEAVTIGAGGTAGGAGTAGAQGGNSTFGTTATFVTGYGGGGGGGGGAATQAAGGGGGGSGAKGASGAGSTLGAGGAAALTATTAADTVSGHMASFVGGDGDAAVGGAAGLAKLFGGSGGSSSPATGAVGKDGAGAIWGGAAGASGGGVTSGNAEAAGGAGGNNLVLTAGGGGTAGAVNGGAGGAGASGLGKHGGQGGGGGGGQDSGTGGTGGVGGAYGGGGGGGGGATTGGTGGVGGTGGMILWWV